MNTNVENATPVDGLQLLDALGFEEAGAWSLVGGALICSLTRHADESKILYAFVSDKQILYIGKSIRTLKLRMNGYEKPGPTQRTNVINHDRIVSLLMGDASIAIYSFVPREQLLYRDVPVNLAAGLEDWIIESLRPQWNHVGYKRSVVNLQVALPPASTLANQTKEENMATLWDKVTTLEGKILKTLNQGREFHIKEVSPDRIVFVPVSGNGTIRWCTRVELETLSGLCVSRDDVTVERMRQEMPESRNTTYLAAILYEAMSVA